MTEQLIPLSKSLELWTQPLAADRLFGEIAHLTVTYHYPVEPAGLIATLPVLMMDWSGPGDFPNAEFVQQVHQWWLQMELTATPDSTFQFLCTMLDRAPNLLEIKAGTILWT